MGMFGSSAPAARRPVSIMAMPWQAWAAPPPPAPPAIPDMGHSGVSGIGFSGAPQPMPIGGVQPAPAAAPAPQVQIPQVAGGPPLNGVNMPSAASLLGQAPAPIAPAGQQGLSGLNGVLQGLGGSDVGSLLTRLRNLAGNYTDTVGLGG